MQKRGHTLVTLANYIQTALDLGWHVDTESVRGHGRLESFGMTDEGLMLIFGPNGDYRATVVVVQGEENGALYGIDDHNMPVRIHAQVKRDDSARRKYIPESSATPDDLNYIGKRFGLLVVESLRGWRGNNRMARCRCDCGGIKDTRLSCLNAGMAVSCGCRRGKNTELPLQTGTRYGLLTLIEQVPRPEGESKKEGYYRARCDCGTEVVRRRELLVRGDKPDCGCGGIPLLVGKRFGRLEIIPGTRLHHRARQVMTKCDCGEVGYANLWALQSGKKRSCGCLKQGDSRKQKNQNETRHSGSLEV